MQERNILNDIEYHLNHFNIENEEDYYYALNIFISISVFLIDILDDEKEQNNIKMKVLEKLYGGKIVMH